MVEIEVKTHWTKTATPDVRAKLQQPMALARATARHIARRLRRGKTATAPQAYQRRADEYQTDPATGRRRRRRYYISPAYAEAAGVPGQTRWLDSAEFHGAAGGQPGVVTGGMLSQTRTRNYGSKAALIEFAGSSLGASSTRTAIRRKIKGQYEVGVSDNGKIRAKQATEFSRDEGGEVKYRRKPKLVRNSLKAGRVFKYLRVGLLQPTEGETAAQLQAVADAAQSVVVLAFGSNVVTSGSGGDPVLLRSIKHEMR